MNIRAMHTPTMHGVGLFSGGGVRLIILLSLIPGRGGGGYVYVPAASIIGTFTTRLDAHMQSL